MTLKRLTRVKTEKKPNKEKKCCLYLCKMSTGLNPSISSFFERLANTNMVPEKLKTLRDQMFLM